MKFGKTVTVAWHADFVVLFSRVLGADYARCTKEQLGTALCFPNGLDWMEKNCGTFSYGAVKKIFSVPVSSNGRFLNIYSKKYSKIFRFQYSELLPSSCLFESPSPLSRTQTRCKFGGFRSNAQKSLQTGRSAVHVVPELTEILEIKVDVTSGELR